MTEDFRRFLLVIRGFLALVVMTICLIPIAVILLLLVVPAILFFIPTLGHSWRPVRWFWSGLDELEFIIKLEDLVMEGLGGIIG